MKLTAIKSAASAASVPKSAAGAVSKTHYRDTVLLGEDSWDQRNIEAIRPLPKVIVISKKGRV